MAAALVCVLLSFKLHAAVIAAAYRKGVAKEPCRLEDQMDVGRSINTFFSSLQVEIFVYLYAEIARRRALETRRVGERRALVFIIFILERPGDNDPPLRGNGAAKSHRRLEDLIEGERWPMSYCSWTT